MDLDQDPLPQYMRIAADTAQRVVSGELREGDRFSGRSLLASQYGVSPETVRKALHLLSDMKVVEVREKKGVTVLSADNARRYLDSLARPQEQRRLRLKLRALLQQYDTLGREIAVSVRELLDAQEAPLPDERRLPNYEVLVPEGSDKIGRNIASLHFWQSTGATIIAIRRGRNLILSPGPYAELYAGDAVIFVGAPECPGAVRQFLSGPGVAPENSDLGGEAPA